MGGKFGFPLGFLGDESVLRWKTKNQKKSRSNSWHFSNTFFLVGWWFINVSVAFFSSFFCSYITFLRVFRVFLLRKIHLFLLMIQKREEKAFRWQNLCLDCISFVRLSGYICRLHKRRSFLGSKIYSTL